MTGGQVAIALRRVMITMKPGSGEKTSIYRSCRCLTILAGIWSICFYFFFSLYRVSHDVGRKMGT